MPATTEIMSSTQASVQRPDSREHGNAVARPALKKRQYVEGGGAVPCTLCMCLTLQLVPVEPEIAGVSVSVKLALAMVRCVLSGKQ